MDNKYSLFPHYEESVNLRTNGEFDYVYSGSNLSIGKTHLFPENRTQDYSQLNEAIVKQGEENTKNLTELMGKASEIKAHPQGYLPFNIPFPTRYQMSNFVTSALNNLGVPMEGSMFVSELLTDVNQKGFGILHATGLGELAEVAEGFPKFQAGLSLKDPGVATEGLLQTVFGGVGAYPFVKDFLKQLTPKAKEGLSWMAGKAREYKANQAPGTKLLSTDPTDPAVDAIIKLDEMVNKPQGPELIGSTDVVVGDVVTFKQDVFGGSLRNPKRIGERLIKGEVVKESYGKDKQQHTFTIRPIEVFGDNASEIMSKKTFRIKGRNLYRYGVDREKWADENARKIVADEKHQRGDKARLERNIRKEGSPSQTIL